ncbi:MAG: hypothetical protein L6R42_005811 [Xanthoria sp. 1 TBL-2021]|nr:MAG: hypothetical protein L6R42_005811 [Xanthoria sp. 1 TBL-2021]
MRPSACLLWIQTLSISVAAFYPYHPRPRPTTALHDRTLLSPQAHFKHAAGGAHQGAPDVVKLHIKHQRARPRTNTNVLIPRPGSHIKRDNSYDFVTASPPTQTNSAGIHNDGTDFSYFTSVEFGSSGKTMHLLVDTGASNTWVMASDCNSEVCAAHNTFGKEHSASLKVSQDEFNLTYGTGSVSGLTATDTLKLAGFSVSLPFGLAHTVSEDFMSYPMDGILGLGPPAGKSTDHPTFMETVQKTTVLSSKLFGVNLQRSSDGATDGELSFGAPDSTKYKGDLSYTSVITGASMWEIPIDAVKVNGNLCVSTGKTAIIDTGTSFMLLPPTDAGKLHALIPGAQEDGEAFIIPCSTKTPIQLKFSDVLYNISPADYVGSPIRDGSSTCTSNILGRQPFKDDQWLVGDVFLKNVYTVFDYDSERIGQYRRQWRRG